MKPKIDFHLILITDSKLNKDLYKIVNKACNAGVKAVQLREKELPPKELLKLAQQLRTSTKKNKAKLFINDRYDIALLSKADGLHAPEKGIMPSHIKYPQKIILGRSVHSLKSAIEAEQNGFDYIIFGPVFKTPSKVKFGSPQGIGKLKEVTASVTIPVFAVGGITPSKAKKCIDAGAFGVAVIREIMQSNNIARTVIDFKENIGSL